MFDDRSTRTLHTVGGDVSVQQSIISQENMHTWNSGKAITRVGTKALPIAVSGTTHDDDNNDVGVALPAPSSCRMRKFASDACTVWGEDWRWPSDNEWSKRFERLILEKGLSQTWIVG